MSDQDFFFDDEDEKQTAKKSSADKGAKASTTAAAPAEKAAPAASAASFFDQNVSMAIAGLMAVIALLVGIIIGIVIPNGNAPVAPDTSTTNVGGGTGVTGNGSPQPLTQDQLNSGTLPAGHPDISKLSSGSAVPTAAK